MLDFNGNPEPLIYPQEIASIYYYWAKHCWGTLGTPYPKKKFNQQHKTKKKDS